MKRILLYYGFALFVWLSSSLFSLEASQLERIKSAESSLRVFGLTVGEASLQDFLSKLGPGIIFEDETNANIKCICYVSDRDETLILFKSENHRYTRFKLISQKMRFYKWHFCERSSRVSKDISIENGIRLGMSKLRVIEILGRPQFESENRLNYEYTWDERLNEDRSHEESISAEITDRSCCGKKTARIDTEFLDSKLISIEVSVY